MEPVIMLIMGVISGWLGSIIFSGRSLGLFGNLIAGILGSAVGYWVLGELGFSFGNRFISAILTGALGAFVVLFIVNLLFPGRKS